MLVNESRAEPMGPVAMGRASITYAMGGFAYKAVALITVPIFARLLSPAELGLLDLAGVLATIIGLGSALGVEQSVAFWERRDGHDVWEGSLLMIVLVASSAMLAAVIFKEQMAVVVTGDDGNSGLVVAAAAYGGVIGLTSLALTATRLRASPRVYATVSFLTATVEMAAALFVAAVLAAPVPVIVGAWAVGAAVIVGPTLVRYMPWRHWPRTIILRRLVRFGAPLAPAAMAWLIGDAIVRSVIARESTLVELGSYGIAQRLASVLTLLVGGFAVAWYPYVLGGDKVVVRARRVLPPVLAAAFAFSIGTVAISPELVHLIAGPPYAGAVAAVPLLSGAMVSMTAFVVLSGVSNSTGRTYVVALAAVAGLAAQATLAIALVPLAGLIGGAAASLGGYTVAAGILMARNRPVLDQQTALRVGLIIATGSVGLVGAGIFRDAPIVTRVLGASVLALVLGMLAVRWSSGGRSAINPL